MGEGERLKMDPLEIIENFYSKDDPLLALLLKHSSQVRDRAMRIMEASGNMKLDAEIVKNGSMLHDIGIIKCHAPRILCNGSMPYIAHGVAGAEMLREYGRMHGMDMEPYARICERHTGSGITRQQIVERGLPLPPIDFLPETPEEKLVCLADKFYSKSGDMKEESLEQVRRELAGFGEDSLRRFDEMMALFNMN